MEGMEEFRVDTCEELLQLIRLFLGEEGVGLTAGEKAMVLEAVDNFLEKEGKTEEFSAPRDTRGGARLEGAARLEEAWTDDPFPTTETKRQLAEELNLTLKQVNDWFTNTRKRRRRRD